MVLRWARRVVATGSALALASCSRTIAISPEAFESLRAGEEIAVTFQDRRVVRGVVYEIADWGMMLKDWWGDGRRTKDRSLLRVEWDEVYEIERVEFDTLRTLASVGSFLAIPVTVAIIVAVKRGD
jgi:hypothetical protein